MKHIIKKSITVLAVPLVIAFIPVWLVIGMIGSAWETSREILNDFWNSPQ